MKTAAANTKIALGILGLMIGTSTFAAEKLGSKVTLSCDVPAAEAVQKVKPGRKELSDGVIRVLASKMSFNICDGCAWEKSGVKWKVTPSQYHIATKGGVEITISRDNGSILYALTSKEDEYYFKGHVESKGQCKADDKSAKNKKNQ